MVGFEYEKKYYDLGLTPVCGVDEAGRGPLAGPVCAAAVVLPPDFEIEGLNDSKKLTEKKREYLFDVICENALDWCVAFATKDEIDEINILQATMLAMTRAINGLKKYPPKAALIDGNRCPQNLLCQSEAIVKGDAKSASVAAASVLAKVSRDRLLIEMDEKYPEYEFKRHKGYPTELHRQKLLRYGPCNEHRITFLKKILPPEQIEEFLNRNR